MQVGLNALGNTFVFFMNWFRYYAQMLMIFCTPEHFLPLQKCESCHVKTLWVVLCFIWKVKQELSLRFFSSNELIVWLIFIKFQFCLIYQEICDLSREHSTALSSWEALANPEALKDVILPHGHQNIADKTFVDQTSWQQGTVDSPIEDSFLLLIMFTARNDRRLQTS